MSASRFFKLEERGTTAGREVQAGVTTFAAMAYILAVNPSILADAGMDRAALVTVTALSAATATAVMALLSNYPLALAPGMGINAFFTYTICVGAGVPWQQALGMVFVNGCVFLLLSLSGLRERVVRAIPYSLTLAITGGIGLFIAFIGLRNGGVVVASPATFVTHGDFTSGPTALCLAGLAVTAVLVARRVPGAIVLGVALTTLVGAFVPDARGGTVTAWPGAPVSMPASPAPVLLQLDLSFMTHARRVPARAAAHPDAAAGGHVRQHRHADRRQQARRVSRCERPAAARGARAGGRLAGGDPERAPRHVHRRQLRGIGGGCRGRRAHRADHADHRRRASCWRSFLTPLILAVPAAATAPALVIVGVFMLQAVVEIDMKDAATAVPAALTLVGIPLLFSIADGIGLGLMAAAVLAVAMGRPRALTVTGYVVAAVFFLQFFKVFPFGG